jgi:sec-independent protein translocase protein TatB
MLDVGFSEILLTSAIALIVLGPEKLPKVARQVGNWVGRARAMARQLTEQLEREVSAEELMKQTKSSNSGKFDSNAATSGAPSSVDISAPPYIPNVTAAVSPPPAAAPPASYSPENAATVHGADWHASPPENKPAND